MATVVIDTKKPEVLLRLTLEEAHALHSSLLDDDIDETDEAFWCLEIALDAHGVDHE